MKPLSVLLSGHSGSFPIVHSSVEIHQMILCQENILVKKVLQLLNKSVGLGISVMSDKYELLQWGTSYKTDLLKHLTYF